MPGCSLFICVAVRLKTGFEYSCLPTWSGSFSDVNTTSFVVEEIIILALICLYFLGNNRLAISF